MAISATQTADFAPIEQWAGTVDALQACDLEQRAKPLVIRGLVADWPMVHAARASATAFAQCVARADSGREVDVLRLPPEEEGVVGYNAAMDGFNYDHYRVSLTLGLQRLAEFSRREVAPGLAIQSALMADCVPGLLATHRVPMLDPAVQPRLWIGNRVTTPVHFDASHNVACVVAGRRRFTLFAPDQLANLYIGPLDFAPTGVAIGIARLDRPDDPRFPRLKEALAQAMSVVLEPGDALYIPPLWWHHVESLDQLNALVNYWWSPLTEPGYTSLLGQSALLHAVLAFRALPREQREGWRRLLDHYAFADHQPIAHVPAARRGVLGERTQAILARLRELARRGL